MEEIKPTPQTSILIVHRNQAASLRRTLESLQALADPKALEVIVVDNASSDGGALIDSEFPFVSMLRMQRNFGYTKAVNVGTRTATGEFLCLTPAGTEFTAESVPALIRAVNSGALAACPLTVDANGSSVTRHYRLPDRAMLARFWRTGERGPELPIDGSSEQIQAEYVVDTPMLLRRQSIVGMNYLDERYGQFWSDAEICFQVRRAGKPLVVLPPLKLKAEPSRRLITERLDRHGAQYSADAAIGAATYLRKREGFIQGALFHVSCIARALLSALFGTLTFQQPGPKWTRFVNLASGQKVDGNQGD